jgi:hypothetical protein
MTAETCNGKGNSKNLQRQRQQQKLATAKVRHGPWLRKCQGVQDIDAKV